MTRKAAVAEAKTRWENGDVKTERGRFNTYKRYAVGHWRFNGRLLSPASGKWFLEMGASWESFEDAFHNADERTKSRTVVAQ